jgi:hypothetical protein
MQQRILATAAVASEVRLCGGRKIIPYDCLRDEVCLGWFGAACARCGTSCERHCNSRMTCSSWDAKFTAMSVLVRLTICHILEVT